MVTPPPQDTAPPASDAADAPPPSPAPASPVPAKRPSLAAFGGFGPVEARGWVPWTVLAVAVSLVLVAIGQIGGVILLVQATPLTWDGLNARFETDLSVIAYTLFVIFGLSAAATLAWTKLIERRSLASIGLSRTGVGGAGRGQRFWGGFGLGLVFACLVLGVMVALGAARVASGPTAWADPVQLAWILVLLAGFIVQGSTEEVIIRGWLMSTITARVGAVAPTRTALIVAVVVSSLVFMVLHGANPGALSQPLALINIALFALFIALYALHEGSIWGACGWHAAWNWLIATGFEIEVSGMVMPIEPWVGDLDAAGAGLVSGGAFGPEASVVTSAVLLSGSAIWGWRLSRDGLGAHRRAAPEAPRALQA